MRLRHIMQSLTVPTKPQPIARLALLGFFVFLSPLTLAHGPVTQVNPADNAEASTIQYEGFNPLMLAGSSEKIDVSRFLQGNVVVPGTYRVDIVVNQNWLGRRDVQIKSIDGSDQTLTCINKTLLIQMGVNLASLPRLAENFALEQDDFPADACVNMPLQIPDSRVEFDSSELRVDVSIPQLYVNRMARGYVDPSQWDQGINAAFLSYNIDDTRSSSSTTGKQTFASINLGVNVEGWRVRYNGTYTDAPNLAGRPATAAQGNPINGAATSIAGSNGEPATNVVTLASGAAVLQDITTGLANPVQQNTHWQPINAFVQHDLTNIKSQLTLGDAYTNPDLFPSVGVQGVQVASDDRMLPESQRGYAPVIRGFAETNAKVTVRQGGNIIDERTVPPGEFKIDDMFNSGYGGDFIVTITETDGRQKSYVVPYSAGVLLLRADSSRYSVAMGKLLNVVDTNAPTFTQVTYQHGMDHGVTLYTGAIVGQYYRSGLIGAALDTDYGGFAMDMTGSEATMPTRGSALSGTSWRLSYSKVIEETRTNFSMAATTYSTSDFLTLSNAAILHNALTTPGQSAFILSPRKSFQLAMSQPLTAGHGSVYVSGVAQYYWHDQPDTISYQAGYSNSASWGTYGLSLSRIIDGFGSYHNLASVSFNFPIGKEGAINRPTVTATTSYGNEQTNTQLGISGPIGQTAQTSYNVYDTYSKGSNTTDTGNNTFGVGAQYAGSSGTVGASYSSGQIRQENVNVSGSVLVHAGGVQLAPSLAETVGIVYAPFAEGASVVNSINNKIGSNGFAIIPYLTPYQSNEVVLDPKGSDVNVALDATSAHIAPRAGAIVRLDFATTAGRAVLIKIDRDDGKSIPLGALAYNEDGKEIGMLAQGGRLFSRDLGDAGRLTVRWGERLDQQCSVDYMLPKAEKNVADQPYVQLALTCSRSPQATITK